jgi:hypothetical protein
MEIPEIKRQDQLRLALHRAGEDAAILWIIVAEWQKVLVAIDQRLGKRSRKAAWKLAAIRGGQPRSFK